MLVNLTISDFAIIDHLDVQFDKGFNVLTGETGAGKSIILEAVGQLLGDRARPELIRDGSSEACIQALFDLSQSDALRQTFIASGLSVDDELVLKRVVQTGGRSRAYINGQLVTLSQLQPLAEQLVMICGQHEHQHLLQKKMHLNILDQFGGLSEKVKVYRETYHHKQELVLQLEKLEERERDRSQRLDLLQHQSEEITAAELSMEEEAALLSERRLLQNTERLSAVNRGGYEVLYDSDGSICEILSALSNELKSIAAFDEELAGFSESIQRHLYELEDVAQQMRSYLDRINYDPMRIETIEERLNTINSLKRKYAPSVSEILKLQSQFDEEINELQRVGENRNNLGQEISKLTERLQSLGETLSKERGRATEDLSKVLTSELVDLAMSGARFEVAVKNLASAGPDGLEQIEFMVSLNPGEPLMPLIKVASGGELSRLMLAIKRVAPDTDKVPTIIFDEVDAGIGGTAATAVGRKLKTVSSSAQVLCVTHLPQVAAFADHHHRVFKRGIQGRTIAGLEVLSGEARVEEMARMLGGAQVTEKTRLHAQELISVSNKR